jgi:hypothetical protein
MIFVVALLMSLSVAASANIYIVIYTTLNGKTGHAGIAVDNYHVIQSDNGLDTIRTHTLTYFDVWPEKDEFELFDFARDHKPVFYVLPNAIWSETITVQSLYDKGIPHREHYPCDAILKVATTASQDYKLIEYLNHEVNRTHRFNPRFYNCSDFVLNAVNTVLGKNLRAKEFIPFSLATTPNKLYRVLSRQKEFHVVKKAPSNVSRSFLRERILKRKATKNHYNTTLAHN